MPRTTIDIDASVLRALKQRQREEGKTMGRLVSEMLAATLAIDEPPAPPAFQWISRPMQARIDLEDKEQVRRALDEA
jgi:hypothetical protein